MRVHAVAIALAQCQVASMASRVCRALQVVQDPVAEGVDVAPGQVGVIGEADQFGPCGQICCCHDDFEACLVRVEGVER
jgi:hypothetical protein